MARLLKVTDRWPSRLEISPRMSIDADVIGDRDVLQPEASRRMDDREPEVLMPIEENPRVKRTLRQEPLRPGRERQALAQEQALHHLSATRCSRPCCIASTTDPTMVAYGEENRDWGGAFAVLSRADRSLPYHRLFNSPISEGAIVGTAVGYALRAAASWPS